MLSMFFPGLGFAYVGNGRKFVTFFIFEAFLFAFFLDWWPLVVLVHLFQGIAAAGAAAQWNKEHLTGPGADIPPPPAPGTRRATAPVVIDVNVSATATSAAPAPSAPRLDADGLLTELQEAWRAFRAGELGPRDFADRKFRVIRALDVREADEEDAVNAAAAALAEGGVLTSEEVAMIGRQAALR
jgi:hypothetical protein